MSEPQERWENGTLQVILRVSLIVSVALMDSGEISNSIILLEKG